MPDAASAGAPEPAAPSAPFAPAPYRVVARATEAPLTVTLGLEPVAAPIPLPRPGQFSMLYAFGIGEAPISVSGVPGAGGPLQHTVRAVGATSRALVAATPGTTLGVRGPFGNGWDLDTAVGADVVVVAGGIGLAPLRPAVEHLLAHREDYGRVAVVVGARSPESLLFVDDLARWRARFDAEVEVTVDAAGHGWRGRVGVVTTLLPRLALDAGRTVALCCGPEVMMRYAARTLTELGVPAGRIRLSLERNMQCALGQCGHCQLGPLLLCRDGPVVGFDRVGPLWEVRGL